MAEFVISAEHGAGLESLRNAIYQSLDVVRVYTKVPSKKEPDYDRPYTIRRGGTLSPLFGILRLKDGFDS